MNSTVFYIVFAFFLNIFINEEPFARLFLPSFFVS
jgi:hypothetical protein